eukprot:TRINITY_DN19848_c0_g1_i1.p1 TRINITY_DN19848_c0_g1~~TRINITY_DN19848_c0_g1_i1.p1  ORF type:complete len:190 (-),score=35.81 TRINITY_DN19848_c0_g1_i1:36-605(-)
MSNKIELVDSDKFHVDRKAEVKYRLWLFWRELRNWITLKQIIILVVWLILAKVAAKLQFGLVFFVLSGIAFIFGTLAKERQGQWSAYSIFNKGFLRPLGEMDIDEQLDAGLGGGRRNAGREETADLNGKSSKSEVSQDTLPPDYKLSLSDNISKKGNMLCYCLSGRKYKKCCYWRDLRELQDPPKDKTK